MIKEPLKLEYDENIKIDSKIFIYFIMFLLSLLVIFRVIPYVFGLIIIFMLAFIFNKKAILTMDWDLILTFCAFFIFSGNVSRISFISDVLVLLLDMLLTGALVACGETVSDEQVVTEDATDTTVVEEEVTETVPDVSEYEATQQEVNYTVSGDLLWRQE